MKKNWNVSLLLFINGRYDFCSKLENAKEAK